MAAQTIWGHKPLARKIGANYYYYIYNGHGDVVQIIDSAGNIVNSYEYDEWGNITGQTEGIANDCKYAGEAYDSETGFYYLRARYYDPTVGRFISQDSNEGQITNPLSLNLYTYCVNNSIKYVDPTGNNPVAIAAAYIYITRVATSPDTMRDLQFIAMDIAEGNYFAAGLDAIGAAVPGVTGVGKTVTKLYDEARSVTHSLAERTSSYVKGTGNAAKGAGKVLRPSDAANKIVNAERVGSGLKNDTYHRAASYLSESQISKGTVYDLGKNNTLLQVKGSVNGKTGIFEYILNGKGQVTHQLFKEGGIINGIPN